MSQYYQMTPKTCYLCKHTDGLVDDHVNLHNHKQIKCNHKIDVGLFNLEMNEVKNFLKDLKKSKQYFKLMETK